MNNNSKTYLISLANEFKDNADSLNACKQKAYLKNHFEFFGLNSPTRREIQKPFLLKKYLPEYSELSEIVKELYCKPQREFHYFAQELAFKYVKQQEKKDILLYESMIRNNSWWDTIDFIAPNLVGNYFLKFPNQRDQTINKWLNSEFLWLQRSSILFQLKYKDKMDYDFLTFVIKRLLGSKEFFINKAIGWILREISKTNPEFVLNFVSNHDLNKLSEREAIRIIK